MICSYNKFVHITNIACNGAVYAVKTFMLHICVSKIVTVITLI